MAATVTDPLLGSVVDGRYEVLRRIARGGMATVYLAQDQRLDRQVALKVMHPHLADGSDVVARFRREARAAARLSHPGVVGVYDQGTEGSASYLTMEFVDGVTLRRRLQAQGVLSLGEALDVLGAVLDALGAAHRAGLVHRDVKPENVLISHEDDVKVADFGLARAVSEATMGTTGALLGTVAYLSPEIITSGAADARADVYSAGVMLYEMLTGEQPFRGETPIQVAYQHVNEPVPPPSERINWLPFEVDDFVARLTARDPADRPLSGAHALAELRTLRRQLPEEALALRADIDADDLAALTHDVTDDLEREGSTTSFSAPSSTVSLPIGAVTTPHATPPADADRWRRARRNRRLKALAAVVLVLLTLGGGAWWYVSLGPGSYVTAPDLTGRAESTATQQLRDLGLQPVSSTAFDDEIPAGHVVSTDPAGGDRVERGGEVGVLVSQGVERLTVPDVAGDSETGAQTTLAEEGFDGTISVEQGYHPEIEAGAVISTTPGSGSVVDHDADIAILVSLGREPIAVPDVSGVGEADALAQLEEAGAVAQTGDREYSDDVPEGQVIRQDVTGDALRGDLVTVIVSLGPQLFEVPGVVGLPYEDAAAELEAAGFTVEREDVIGGFFGWVREQSVAAGEMVEASTLIVLTVV